MESPASRDTFLRRQPKFTFVESKAFAPTQNVPQVFSGMANSSDQTCGTVFNIKIKLQ
jgi:hypothetical protein